MAPMPLPLPLPLPPPGCEVVISGTNADQLRARIATVAEDDKAGLVELGVELATSQCRQLLEHGVAGLHFYTMDRSKSALGIIERLRSESLL